MNKIDMKYYILPLYLLIVLLVQIKTNPQNILLVTLPIIIIIFSIYKKHKTLAISGMFAFYTLSIYPITVSNMEDYFQVFLQIFFVITPSIILLSIFLQIENEKIFIFSTDKKPIITAAILITIIFSVFYLISTLSLEGFLLSSESVPGQILLLTGITIFTCMPFFIKSSEQ